MKKWTILGLASAALFALGAFTGQQLPAQPAGKAAATKEPTWVHAFNLMVRSAGERKKRTTPMEAQTPAQAIASPGELSATSSATSIGPAMNITSISTESSE